MKDRILHYLASGIKPAQVATIVGCTPAYISQLLAEEGFREKLKGAIADQPVEQMDEKLGTKYEAMEHLLLNKMQESLVDAELPAVTKALHTVAMVQDMRHKRKNPTVLQPGNSVNIQYVSLTLPAQMRLATPVIDMNAQQEILSIDSQPLAPLSADGVKSLFQKLKEKREGARNANEFITVNAATASA